MKTARITRSNTMTPTASQRAAEAERPGPSRGPSPRDALVALGHDRLELLHSGCARGHRRLELQANRLELGDRLVALRDRGIQLRANRLELLERLGAGGDRRIALPREALLGAHRRGALAGGGL